MAENFALQVLQNQRKSLQLEYTRLKAQRDTVADQLEALQLRAEQLDHAITGLAVEPYVPTVIPAAMASNVGHAFQGVNDPDGNREGCKTCGRAWGHPCHTVQPGVDWRAPDYD